MKHGDIGHCEKCGARGRYHSKVSDDQGPEFDDWIGRRGKKPVCHACDDT